MTTHYPQKEGEPDCRDFIRTGRCKYGESCKYNHPDGGGTTLSDPSEPLFPFRPDEPPCSYYLKHGFCKFGQSCKFHHPPMSPDNCSAVYEPFYISVDFPKETIVNTTDINFVSNTCSTQTLPQRPGELNCTYYMRFGTCKFGFHCRYNHPLRKEFIEDELIQSHDIIMRNNQRDDRGRSFSVGSLTEARLLRSCAHDGFEKRRSLKGTQNALFHPNVHFQSSDHRYLQIKNPKTDLKYGDQADQNVLFEYDMCSSAHDATHFVPLESQGLLHSSIRNENRERSQSSNDLYNSYESSFSNTSLQRSFQKKNKPVSSSTDAFTTYCPSQSEDNSLPKDLMDQRCSLTINNISSVSVRHPQLEKYLISETNLDVYSPRSITRCRFQDQYNSQSNFRDRHTNNHSSILHSTQSKENMLSNNNSQNIFNENVRLMGSHVLRDSLNATSVTNHDSLQSESRNYCDQNESSVNENRRARLVSAGHIHQTTNYSFQTSLPCIRQLEQSLNHPLTIGSQNDDNVASSGKKLEYSLIFPISAPSKKENPICQVENLWKYP